LPFDVRYSQQVVQLRVVERPRHDGHRLELQRMRQGLLLPESEMAGAEQNALALRERQPHALLAFPFHERQLHVARQRRVLQQFEQQAPEMLEHRFRDGPALFLRSLGKGDLQVCDGNPAMYPIGQIEQQPEELSGAPHR
jgi:hypothetical protein